MVQHYILYVFQNYMWKKTLFVKLLQLSTTISTQLKLFIDAYFGKTFAYSLNNNFSIIKSTFKNYVLVDVFFVEPHTMHYN